MMPCYTPLKGYLNVRTQGLTFKRSESLGQSLEVACGQCLGCRLDRSRMWAMRIVHETTLYECGYGSCFVTLTYRTKSGCSRKQLERGYHVPDDWSLDLSHFQKFMKRLRKAYSDRKIRFFHVGEYGAVCRHGLEACPIGCTVGRPHYHAILFNVSFDDMEPFSQKGEQVYYTSAKLEALWKYGFVQVGEVTFQSAAYTARYCMKKINGKRQDEHYRSVDEYGEVHQVLPEYATMSRRPGLGQGWFEKYKADCFPADDVPVPGEGVIKKVPRYYEKLFELEAPEVLESVKDSRKLFRKEHADEYSPERLRAKYKVKEAQVAQLKRGFKDED